MVLGGMNKFVCDTSSGHDCLWFHNESVNHKCWRTEDRYTVLSGTISVRSIRYICIVDDYTGSDVKQVMTSFRILRSMLNETHCTLQFSCFKNRKLLFIWGLAKLEWYSLWKKDLTQRQEMLIIVLDVRWDVSLKGYTTLVRLSYLKEKLRCYVFRTHRNE